MRAQLEIGAKNKRTGSPAKLDDLTRSPLNGTEAAEVGDMPLSR